MAQAHGDRLTAVDASFLAQEVENAHMHVGAVLIFEGPPPDYDDFCAQIRGRLHLVPRYRQKLAFPPLETGRPLWVDDPNFNLQYHVRHTALPSPGSEEQLRALAARVHSQRLDRSKPLWETWLVQGLEGNRFALISKTHHALVDGISGVDLATVLFDTQPVPPEAPHEGEPWVPQQEPSAAQLAARGIRGLVRTPFELGGRALGAAAHPQRSIDVARNELSDFQRVKDALGGTVNDVVLTVVAGALRHWLRSRGVRTEGMELRALVPVSIRAEDQHHTMGNRIAAMRGPLPVYVEDPVARLAVVREAMNGLKDSKQAVGAEVLAGVQSFAPPTVLAQASRINFSTRLFNLIVTNVPGPQLPLYVLGRALLDLFPIAFLPRDHALAVAVMSYNGGMDFGLLGDYDAMPDLDELGQDLSIALEELVVAAEKQAKANGGKAARKRAPSKRTPA